MKKFNLSNLAVVIASALLMTPSFANEQPQAKDLVGKVYGGLHLMHIKTDNERLINADPRSDIDHASGFGGEIGYRFTETTEFRLSHTMLNLVKDSPGFKEPDGSSTAVDVLYFPTQENFYVVGGVDYLDIADSKVSADLGAGYRYHLNERAALYVEGKSHYQFSEHFADYSAKLGFIYFFGDSAKSTPVKQAAVAPVVAAVAVVEMDSDKDGILDKNDQCANTPMSDKTDTMGCTIFTDAMIKQTLHVNFDNNKAVVKEQYFTEIEDMAKFMNVYPHVSLVIEGHTSKQGGAKHNKMLSQQRADAIVSILVNKFAINANRLSAVGYGEERLINLADNDTAHAENRRIEAKVEVNEKTSVKR